MTKQTVNVILLKIQSSIKQTKLAIHVVCLAKWYQIDHYELETRGSYLVILPHCVCLINIILRFRPDKLEQTRNYLIMLVWYYNCKLYFIKQWKGKVNDTTDNYILLLVVLKWGYISGMLEWFVMHLWSKPFILFNSFVFSSSSAALNWIRTIR